MEKPAKPAPALQSDNTSMEFLLKEYERLAEYQKVTFEAYARRFDIYLAAGSAAFVGIVTISQSQSMASTQREMFSLMILAGLLILGFNIFAALSDASVWQIHYERAMRLLQKYFVERETILNNFLYFDIHQVRTSGARFRTLLLRGVTGGGPKSILIIADSTVLAVLVVRIGAWLGLTMAVSVEVIAGLTVFLLASLLHVAYARWIYKINGI